MQYMVRKICRNLKDKFGILVLKKGNVSQNIKIKKPSGPMLLLSVKYF